MGERLPLTFPDFEAYRDFRNQLSECFASEGITDAVVLQVGRAVTGWEVDPAKIPEVMILHMANPVVSFPNNETIKQAYKKFKFVAAIGPWVSETADLYADVILPAATLEKYEGPIKPGDQYVSAISVRTPPSEPLGQSRGEIDIYVDLMERLELLHGDGGYLAHVNEQLELPEDLAIPLEGETPTARDMLDRWVKAQGVEEGIAYMEEHGVKVKGPADMKEFYGYAYDPPFAGALHRFYGESLRGYARQMEAMGAEEAFWQDYTALPTWRQPTKDMSPAVYDLDLISYKLVENKQSRSSFMPLLAELAPTQRLDINPLTAAPRGIGDGDEVVVESHNAVTGERRSLTVHANFTELIRPDVVGMPHHFGLWAHPSARGQGPTPNAIIPTGRGYVANTGDQSFHVKVRVYRP